MKTKRQKPEQKISKLEKELAVKNRELEIEAALEKVRSKSLAMHKSKELKIVITILLQQLEKVGILLDTASIVIPSKDKKTSVDWTASKKYKYSKGFIVPFMENGKPALSGEINRDMVAALKSGKEFTKSYSRKEKNKYYQNLFDKSGFNETPEARKKFLLSLPGVSVSTAGGKNSYIQIFSYSGEELSAADLAVLKRFAMVFEQCYIRFQDLEKAEAQAREAQIEASLEKVRTIAMGMRKPDDMPDVCKTISRQLKSLGVKEIRNVQTAIFYPERSTYMNFEYYAKHNKTVITETSYTNNKLHYEFAQEMLKGKGEFFISHIKGKKVKDWIAYQKTTNVFIDKYLETASSLNYYWFSLGPVALGISTYEPLTEEEIVLFKRFLKVFELAYKRYLDIEKALAQAREAQIEAALERVRARSIAMHKSNELKDVVRALYKEFRILVTDIDSVNIQLNLDSSKDIYFWASVEEDIYPELYHIPYSDLPIFEKFYNTFNSPGEGFFDHSLNKKEKDAFFREVFKIQPVPPKRKKMIQNAEGMVMMGWFHRHSGVDIVRYNLNHFSEEEKKIVKRFAAAFEQTYIRFLDLQKAEAQAKESEIQLALERVRARTMAMHKSDELAETAAILFQQMTELGVTPERLNICLIKEEDKILEVWATDQQGVKISHHFNASLDEPTTGKRVYEAWKEKKKSIVIDLNGKELNDWIRYVREVMGMTIKPELVREHRIHSVAFFSQGLILTTTPEPLPEESIKLLERFADVFNLTYRRFLDLQKAEAQAREAIKQASLDRVRGEIASMRTSEDLNRITPIIWHELKAVEVPFIRCGVFIINEETEETHVYLSTPEGKALGVLNLGFDENDLTRNTVKFWREKEIYKEHWNKEEFINWTQSMMKLGQVQNAETYQGSSAPPESLDLHFIPFAQGMLYVGDVSRLTDEKLDLVKTLAEAFAIAYARYEDFKQLEEAKNKIEITLNELKAAQAQLVHSEKMASLGELTAGIAHEIKNPLNFVNNFSEISRELLDEVKEELEKNDKEEVLSILEDLKQNLEKINQHGKRADSIVKGMLLHSRGTSGEKALTDINDLLDQYINLAYHGMRAQNKEFNITIEKDFDETLEKVNVVPQDISRVFLNIINNACYAAYEKKKINTDENFSPVLKVSTKNLNGKVEIKIEDNGNGIPKDIRDKIFQPFFTTKPTGEGTGLGLSLSYDIVTKVHGGELKVETKEGEGAKFIITLPKI